MKQGDPGRGVYSICRREQRCYSLSWISPGFPYLSDLTYPKSRMKKVYTRTLLLTCAASLLLSVCGVDTHGQEQNQGLTQPEQLEQSDDVIRISTDLVQVGVSVLDRNGRFVEGLTKEDFEMKVDGKLVDVGFF